MTSPYSSGNGLPSAPPGYRDAPITSGPPGYRDAPIPPTDEFGQALARDPLYTQAKANTEAERLADLSGFGANAARAFIQFGEMPAFSGADAALFSDLPQIDPATGQLAQANTSAGLSTLARLRQAYQDAVRTDTNQLASRGLFHSGETGFRLGRDQTDFARAQYDARQALLDYLSGQEGSYTAGQRARVAALQQAAADAAARQQYLLSLRGPPAPPEPQLPQPIPQAIRPSFASQRGFF